MSEMQDKDSILLFVESMKKAASLARSLAKSTGVKEWMTTATGLDALRAKGEVIYNRPAPNWQTKMAMVDRLVEKLTIHPGNDKVH